MLANLFCVLGTVLAAFGGYALARSHIHYRISVFFRAMAALEVQKSVPGQQGPATTVEDWIRTWDQVMGPTENRARMIHPRGGNR